MARPVPDVMGRSAGRGEAAAQDSGTSGWRPCASLEALRARASLLARVRRFFEERGVMEVETPQLASATVTDPRVHSLTARYAGPGAPRGRTLYLQTSPEFAMKRLLAAGAGSIYQIGRAFRDGEAGRLHNPEFTLLEWYRVGFDHRRLMDEVAELVIYCLEGRLTLEAPERLSYRDVFMRHAGLDPWQATEEELAACGRRCGLELPPSLIGAGRNEWLDWLMGQVVGPRLGRGRLTFVFDYPAEQAALARIRPGDPPVAERFELYLEGMELANGFHELADAGEQRRRFLQDLDVRRAERLPAVPVDERLLDALSAGLPDCAGVALGVDRLLMAALGVRSIRDVIAFPLDRA